MINNLRTSSSILSTRERYKSSKNPQNNKYESANNYANDCVKIKNANKRLREPGEVNFCGLSATGKIPWFYRSKGVKKALEFVEKSQLVFGAGFALILTGLFRPAAIMTLPGKKNKEDKIYASAHSIASGIIGFAISTLIFTPFTNAANKFKAKPADFIKNKDSYLFKKETVKEIVNNTVKEKQVQKALTTAGTYVDRLPDILFSIPKGILTVALIPPILKYVFGWEKKKLSGHKQEQIKVDYTLLNFKSLTNGIKKTEQAEKGGLI